jgi:hypothetical protein
VSQSSVDKQALLNEIAQFSTLPSMAPTDITLEDVMERLNASKNTARARMDALVAAGKWEKAWVWDPERCSRRRVWRKMAPRGVAQP